jgi:hypothetical protein
VTRQFDGFLQQRSHLLTLSGDTSAGNVQQRRQTARIEVVNPLEHGADMTTMAAADLGGAGVLLDVAQDQKALASAGMDRLQAKQSQQLRSQGPTRKLDAYHGTLMA